MGQNRFMGCRYGVGQKNMGVKSIELATVPPQASWAVNKMIPKSHLSTFYAPGGVGKTRLISHLAAQITRPEGLFLGHPTAHGRVVILDADDPTGFGYLVWLNRFLNGYSDCDRSLLDLRAIQGGLTPVDLTDLQLELQDKPPVVLIVDTFASAFLGVDTIKGKDVQQVLTLLASLAADLGCAVITLDHVGKLKMGETVASRGPYGSAKTFAPRAIFALSRVPPNEVQGLDVIRLDCTKMSYAPELPPIGAEIILSNNDQSATVKQYRLPHATQREAAQDAILQGLKQANGETVKRQALLELAVEKANITTRYAEKVLADLVRDEHRISCSSLGGRGNAKGFSWQGLEGASHGVEYH